MTSSQKRGIKRAIDKAVAYVDEKNNVQNDYDRPSNFKQQVARRALTIAMLNSGKTWGTVDERDAIDYAETLI